MTRFCRKYLFAILGWCAVFCVCSAELHAEEIYTGMYGLWAWHNWDEGAQILRDNKFQITIGMADKKLLDKAQEKGLRYIVALGLTKEIADDEVKWQNFFYKTWKQVNAFKGHSALFAWYPVDEPDWQKISITKIKEVTELIRSVDKTTPIYSVFGFPPKWHEYLPYFDIIAVEPYLTPGATTDKVRQWLVKVKDDLRDLKLKKPVWVVLGAFEQVPLNPKDRQPFFKPTPDDFNKMLAISLNEGVSGVLIYSLSFPSGKYKDWNIIRDDPLLWEEVRKVPYKVKK